jgi:hypothetical protein
MQKSTKQAIETIVRTDLNKRQPKKSKKVLSNTKAIPSISANTNSLSLDKLSRNQAKKARKKKGKNELISQSSETSQSKRQDPYISFNPKGILVFSVSILLC